MNKEIQLFVSIGCLFVYALSATTTISPQQQKELDFIEQRRIEEELGLICEKTCRTDSLSKHGTCLAPVVDSCTRYISCDQMATAEINKFKWIGKLMSCSHGTFFAEASKTCTTPEQARCRFDKCVNDNTLVSYDSSTGCKTFWECAGELQKRRSVPKCCPANQKYSITKGGCEPDPMGNCTETCNLLQNSSPGYECQDNTMWGASCENQCSPHCVNGTCDPVDGECKCQLGYIGNRCTYECTLKPHPDGNHLYIKSNETFQCGMGTVFSYKKCTCDIDPVKSRRRVNCNALVYTNFTNPQNQWGIKNWQGYTQIENYGIDIEPKTTVDGISHYGYFDGKSYGLIMAFSHNTQITKTFATRIVFRPENGQTLTKQPLMSNCYEITTISNKNAPLEIAILGDDIIISIYTKEKMKEDIKVKYEPGQWTILDFLLSNNVIKAKTITLDSRVIDNKAYRVEGEILPGAGMHIGKCDYIDGFRGQMAEIAISLCDPGFKF